MPAGIVLERERGAGAQLEVVLLPAEAPEDLAAAPVELYPAEV
jgi:hypothetical protein